LDESSKPKPIFQTHNPWNHRPGFSKITQLSTNLILKDEIEEKYSINVFNKVNKYK
jgi:hypothetical protein